MSIIDLPQAASTPRVVVSALNVTVLDDNLQRALDQVSVNVGRGITAILGTADSGAAVLLDCLAGRRGVDAGHVITSDTAGFLRCDLLEDYVTARIQLARLGEDRPQPRNLVVATHDPQVAALADRVLVMAHGRIVDDIG